MMNLEQLLRKIPDSELYDIQTELIKGVVPATGYARSFIRRVNKMIDAGNLRINETSYRKVYLPSLARAVQRELSYRYYEYLQNAKGFVAEEF